MGKRKRIKYCITSDQKVFAALKGAVRNARESRSAWVNGAIVMRLKDEGWLP